jgi:triacylglycerol esterase/lipase EstA (alpha/beta hydrolase family)
LEPVTFSWLPARRAVTYTLSLNYVGTFPPGPFPCGMGASRQRTGITSTTFRCGGFRNDGQRYIWSVSACNSRGCTTSPSLGFINGNPTGPDGGPNNDDAGNVPQPFDPPPADDRNVVVMNPNGTTCQYAADVAGSRTFQIPVTRVVTTLANVDGNGYLRNAAALANNQLISKFATLTIAAFDVDASGAQKPTRPAERDEVVFNGRSLGYLKGQNRLWEETSFEVGIQYVKFPRPAAIGTAPDPAYNTVEIRYDTANPRGDRVWCMAVDWVSLSFQAMSPVILIHGNNSDGEFFSRQGFTSALEQLGVPYDKSITMPTESVNSHALRLAGSFSGSPASNAIPQIAEAYGTRTVHLVAHSKGGLDSREYLARYYGTDPLTRPFSVVSLTTLSTPHQGSPLADEAVTAQAVARGGNPDRIQQLAAMMGIDAGTPNLTTDWVGKFNRETTGLLPTDITYISIAADADRSGNRRIDAAPDLPTELLDSEVKGLRIEQSGFVAQLTPSLYARTIDFAYQRLRRYTAVTCEIGVTADGVEYCVRVRREPVRDARQAENDVLVPIWSGQGPPGGPFIPFMYRGADARNHSNVADAAIAREIVPILRYVDSDRGILP